MTGFRAPPHRLRYPPGNPGNPTEATGLPESLASIPMNATLAPARATTGSPSTPAPAATATVVILASIMTVLDTTIINVALEHLTGAFDAPLATIAWVATGYTLALATVIPVTAWAMGRFGAKR